MKEPASRPSLLIIASQPPTPAGVPCEHNAKADQHTRQHIAITVSENPRGNRKQGIKHPPSKTNPEIRT